MKAWIISDVHSMPMEAFWNRPLLVPKADVCICAGDVSGLIDTSIDFLNAVIAAHMPVVATLGNHDYYGRSIEWALDYARKHTAGTNIRILENETFEIDGLRVIGATLWTDYEIPFGVPESEEELPLDARRDLALHVCSLQLADYTEIYRSDARRENEVGFVTIEQLISRHIRSRAYIKRQLAKPFDGKTLVLSHHAPSPRSLHPNFMGLPSNAAFASDLTAIIKKWKPDYWVHGHVHHFLDYLEDDTRIICNARGYFHEREVNGFRPGFVIEI